jgi:hypothetical protein
MNYYTKLLELAEEAHSGKINDIPIGLGRLSNLISIRKGQYTLIGGNTGTGKSAFMHQIFIFETIKYCKANNIPITIFLWSGERRPEYLLAKWVCYHLYDKYRILASVDYVLGYNQKKVSKAMLDFITEAKDYFASMLNHIHLFPAENPTGIYNTVRNYAKANGEYVKYMDNGYEKTKYVPNDPEEYVLIGYDTIGILKGERNLSKKEIIDKYDEYMRILRDSHNYCPLAVSQFNRAIGGTDRLKLTKDLNPILEDFKDSSNVSESADLVVALFNPNRYGIEQHIGYNVKDYQSRNGESRLRSFHILKNSYGIDDLKAGLVFKGEIGHFTLLPRPDDINDDIVRACKNIGINESLIYTDKFVLNK